MSQGRFTPILKAARDGQLEIVRQLLDHGASSNVKDKVSQLFRSPRPVWQVAATAAASLAHLWLVSSAPSRVPAIVKLAMATHGIARCDGKLQLFAWTTSSSQDRRTPLHNAALGGHTELARLLLDHGAKLNAKNKVSQSTPLLAMAGCQQGRRRRQGRRAWGHWADDGMALVDRRWPRQLG